MKISKYELRYAHAAGFTGCVFSESGRHIVTSGSDGDIRIWSGIDDDDPISDCIGEFVLAIDQFEDKLLVCTDVNTVNCYEFPKIKFEKTKFRFTAPSICVKVSDNYIAAGSEDFGIKFIKRNESELEKELNGHEGPVLHVDINGNILASSSGDGTIKIWNLEEAKVIKTISGLPKAKSYQSATYLISPSFEPNSGEYLAYCDGNQIIVLKSFDWSVKTTLKHSKITTEFSRCEFSHCGQFIAAGTIKGEMIIFNFIDEIEINEAKSSFTQSEQKPITSISWNRKKPGELVYCDAAGQLGKIDVIFDETRKQKKKNAKTLASDFFDDECSEVDADEDDIDNDMDNGIDDGMGDDIEDDEDNESAVSLEKLKNETYADYGLELEDDVLKVAQDSSGDEDDDVKSKVDKQEYSRTPMVMPKVYNQQPPFQPGATPENLTHRYLAWNGVGIIRAHSDDAEGSIDVEFHDVNLHHALQMNNYLNHTMGSLSSTVVALSGYDSSKLVCITLGAAGSREWSVEMPECNGIKAVAATNYLVAVATENRYIRIFSVMGTQREVVSIPGPVIAVCGHENKLMVLYHSAPASEEQYISAMLLETFGLTLRSRFIPVPTLPNTKITWIGFSDCGSPVIFDTTGILKLYNVKANYWFPICDTNNHTQSISNRFYIVDVLESTQTVQAVLCRGNPYPMTSPKPIVSELPMQISLCDIDSDKSSIEETLIRYANLKVDGAESNIKESAIKLFALACRSEMEARAKELVEMIGSTQLLSLAVKYASKLGRIHLADKLSELLPQIEEQEKEREKQMKEAEMDTVNLLSNSLFGENLICMYQKKSLSATSQQMTPILAPKPLSAFSGTPKRNPFKKSKTNTRTSLINSNPTNSPLSHLIENQIGSSQFFEKDPIEQSEDNNTNKTSQIENGGMTNKENNNEKSNQETFKSWFSKNKEKLIEENPDMDTAQLTKVGMKIYKSEVDKDKKPVTTSTITSLLTNKRKIDNDDEDDVAEKREKRAENGGLAKLARFENF